MVFCDTRVLLLGTVMWSFHDPRLHHSESGFLPSTFAWMVFFQDGPAEDGYDMLHSLSALFLLFSPQLMLFLMTHPLFSPTVPFLPLSRFVFFALPSVHGTPVSVTTGYRVACTPISSRSGPRSFIRCWAVHALCSSTLVLLSV